MKQITGKIRRNGVSFKSKRGWGAEHTSAPRSSSSRSKGGCNSPVLFSPYAPLSCSAILFLLCCANWDCQTALSQPVSQSVWEEKQASKLLTHLYYSGEDQRKVTTHMAIPLLDPTMPMLAATITITTTNITILLRLAREVCLEANSFSRYSENRTAHAVNDRGFGERLGIIWLTLL